MGNHRGLNKRFGKENGCTWLSLVCFELWKRKNTKMSEGGESETETLWNCREVEWQSGHSLHHTQLNLHTHADAGTPGVDESQML